MSGQWDTLKDGATGKLIAARFSANEMRQFLRWFEIAQNTGSRYLAPNDCRTARKVHEMLGEPVPPSIVEGCKGVPMSEILRAAIDAYMVKEGK
jgi:hypothetical protein